MIGKEISPSKPLISVIIPTFQEEKLISGTLDQFTHDLKSRYSIEVIVSDGGSTDRTLSIAEKMADRVVRNEKNIKQNISIGRNLGARMASGEIFIFFNADTIIEDPEEFFLTMTEVINTAGVAAGTCNVFIYPGEQTFIDRFFHKFYNFYFWLLNLFGMGMGRGECHVIKKTTFLKIGGYNELVAAGEDYELFLRLRKLGKIAFVKSLAVFESPRRYRKYGYLYITVLWFINAFSVFFLRRSILNEWKPIR